jgi:hypothetical protein
MAKMQTCCTENVVKFITVDTLHVTSNAAGNGPHSLYPTYLGVFITLPIASYEPSCFPLRVNKKSQAMSEVCVCVCGGRHIVLFKTSFGGFLSLPWQHRRDTCYIFQSYPSFIFQRTHGIQMNSDPPM